MPGSIRQLDIAAPEGYVTTDTVRAFTGELGRFAEDPEISAVIIHGSSDAFCLGRRDQHQHTDPEKIRADLQPLLDFNTQLQQVPYVVIAAVEGAAHGFGFGLAAASDITVVASNASLCMDEIRHDIPPLLLASYLPRLTHPKIAFRLLITGDHIPADDALAAGLVTEVVPPGSALARAREIASTIADTDPTVIRMLRRHVREVMASYAADAAARGASTASDLIAQRRKHLSSPRRDPWA